MKPGYKIVKSIEGYCYPRNGNCGNPTPRYIWTPYFQGKPIGAGYASKRAAIEVIEIHEQER